VLHSGASPGPDREGDPARTIVGISHQAVSFSCGYQAIAHRRAVQLATSNKLMQTEAGAVEGVIA
jgi:hypothetical protein